jgi:hypothetical protein
MSIVMSHKFHKNILINITSQDATVTVKEDVEASSNNPSANSLPDTAGPHMNHTYDDFIMTNNTLVDAGGTLIDDATVVCHLKGHGKMDKAKLQQALILDDEEQNTMIWQAIPALVPTDAAATAVHLVPVAGKNSDALRKTNTRDCSLSSAPPIATHTAPFFTDKCLSSSR